MLDRRESIIIITGHYPPPENAAGYRLKAMVKVLRTYTKYRIMVIDLARRDIEYYTGEYEETVFSPRQAISASSPYYIINRLRDLIHLGKIYETIANFISKLYIKPVLIISTVPPGDSVKIGYKIARKYQAKFVIDFHDLTDEWRLAEDKLIGFMYKAYFDKYVYKIAKNADLIITTTEFAASFLERKLKTRNIVIIHNGVDTTEFNQAYLNQINKRKRDLLFIFVGNLNWKYHRLDSFIKAIKILKLTGIDIKLIVVGKGKYKSIYEKLVLKLNIADNVKFTGFVSRSTLLNLYGKADFGVVCRPATDNVWIYSSDRITLYEYLASGLPVLAYGPKYTYIEYIIKKYNLGLYIESDNPYIISNTLMSNVELLSKIKPSHIRKYAIKYRDWNKIMIKLPKILSLYE